MRSSRAIANPRPATLYAYRYTAAQVLTLAASSAQPETLHSLVLQVVGAASAPIERVATEALAASLGAGNWREQRAEAAQRLRDGWTPRPMATSSPIARHYAAAVKAHPMPSMSGELPELDRLSIEHGWRRRVSREFHKRLKRAGIPVEEGRAPGTWW